jgi:uncharacterized protein YacL
MTSNLYSNGVNKPNPLNTAELCNPFSGHYSFRKDIRLNAWFVVAAVLYVINMMLAKRHPEWSPTTRATLALVPLLPGLLYIRSLMRFVRGMDELQRRIQLEAWLFATIGTILVGMAISTLNSNGVRFDRVENGLGMGQAFIVAFILWIVGTKAANRRYK